MNTRDLAYKQFTHTPSNVINIRSAKKAQATAQAELVSYMMWTMQQDRDPHCFHDDPIQLFRAEMKSA